MSWLCVSLVVLASIFLLFVLYRVIIEIGECMGYFSPRRQRVTLNNATPAEEEEKIIKKYEERKTEEARVKVLNAYTRNYMPGSSIAIPAGVRVYVTEPGSSGTYIYTLEGMQGKVLGYIGASYELNHLVVQVSVGKYVGTITVNPHL